MNWLWLPISVLLLIDVVWARVLGITINYLPILPALALVIWLVYSKLRPDPRIATIAMAVAVLNVSLVAVSVFTYLALLSGRPPIDAALAAADKALGFDWPGTYAYVMERPALERVLSFFYWSVHSQIAVLIIFLNVTRRLERTNEFMTLFVLTVLACTAGAFIWPADSAWAHYVITGPIAYHLPHLEAMRAGTMLTLSTGELHGMITFPSFHATLGVLLIYAARGTVLFWPGLVLNIGMIAATPTIGGHHFVDVPAGLALALVAIVLHRFHMLTPQTRGG